MHFQKNYQIFYSYSVLNFADFPAFSVVSVGEMEEKIAEVEMINKKNVWEKINNNEYTAAIIASVTFICHYIDTLYATK